MMFDVELKATEIVLRGGQMKKPVLISGLTCRDGKKYIYLWKNSNDLSKGFAGLPACKRPLANTMVFEKLAQARNVKRSALLAELANDGEVSGDELAPAADLDLDVDIGPKASAAGRCDCPRRAAGELAAEGTVVEDAVAKGCPGRGRRRWRR